MEKHELSKIEFEIIDDALKALLQWRPDPVTADKIADLRNMFAREELYERARSIIIAELRKQNPKISALAITREEAALEAAIRRLEAELQPRASKGSPHGLSDVADADHPSRIGYWITSA
jgi:hypothetical protein